MNVQRSISALACAAILTVTVAVLCQPSSAMGQELSIAAAADLNFAMKELTAAFEKKNHIPVKLSLGSSGNFFAQIQNGAPFDLYFSADIRYPQKLEEAGLTVPGSLYKYAVGRLVLWTPATSKLDVQKGMDVLLEPSIRKIAIANPKHAPYGRAAVAAMEYFNLYDRLRDKLVFGENISQAAQFIESGACDTGMIALSLALAPAMQSTGKYWTIPTEAHPPLEQGTVILKSTRNEEAAKTFLEFLKGSEGQEIMKRYGFTLPG